MNATETVQPLPGGCLPCLDCGTAVVMDEHAPVIELSTRGSGAQTLVMPNGPGLPVPLSRCEGCRDRHVTARRLAQTLGASVLATSRLACALTAAAAAGMTLPTKLGADDATAYLRHLADFGPRVQWADRLVPEMQEGAGLDQCAAEPWSHLDPSLRLELRARTARVLAERVSGARTLARITPPEGGGCLYCGVGSVPAPARDVAAAGGPSALGRRLWRSVVASGSVLGGARGPQPLRGSLCPACAEAHDAAGGVFGQGALIRAVRAHLASLGRDSVVLAVAAASEYQVSGLIAWGALSPAQPPNAEPWAHLDLTKDAP